MPSESVGQSSGNGQQVDTNFGLPFNPLAEVFEPTSAKGTKSSDVDQGRLKVSSSIAHFEETPASHVAPYDAVLEPLLSSQNASPNAVHEQQGNAVSGPLNVALRSDSVQSTTGSYADHAVQDIMKRIVGPNAYEQSSDFRTRHLFG